MRTLLPLLLAAALAFPVTSVAARAAQGDGSLAVANATAVVTIQVKGVVFGHFDRGKMTVLEYKSDSVNALPTVSGAKMDVKGAKANVVYSGRDVRFLFPSGTFTLRFDAVGIDLSAVGRGWLTATEKGGAEVEGTVSLNGGKPGPLPAAVAFGSQVAVTANTAAQNSGRP